MRASDILVQDVMPGLDVDNASVRFPSIPDFPLNSPKTATTSFGFEQPDFLAELLACEKPHITAPTYADNSDLVARFLASESPGERIEIRNQLIEANQGLVITEAASVAGERRDLVDALRSEGQIGLIHAIERCDPSRIATFGGFARWQIRGHMFAYLRRERQQVLPDHAIKRLAMIRKAIRRIADKRGLDGGDLAATSDLLSDSEIAAEAGLFPGTVEFLRPFIGGNVEIDAPTDEERPSSRAIADSLGTSEATPDELIELTDFAVQNLADVQLAMKALNRQQQNVIRLYFGLGKATASPARVIGAKLGVSRARVSYVLNESLMILRRELTRIESMRRLTSIRARTTRF